MRRGAKNRAQRANRNGSWRVNDSELLSADDDMTAAQRELDARAVAKAVALELDVVARVRTRSCSSSAVRRARQSSWRASREPEHAALT